MSFAKRNKMRITYIANFRFPTEKAHGIQIAKMCEAFAMADIELELVVPKKSGKQADPFVFYGIKKNFSVKKIWSPSFFISSRAGFLLSSAIFGLMSFLHIAFKKDKGIIYSMDLDPVSFVTVPFLKRPYFFDLHGPKKNNVFNRFLFKKINGIITINEAVKQNLEKTFGFLKNKIIVCPNGVDSEKGLIYDKKDVRKKLGLDTDKKIAVYTGSLQDWKGIETIIESAKKLKDILFYFVGGSKEDAGLPENVRFAGWKDFKEMPLWRAAADILIATGTKKNEYSYLHTSPMKLFEYMASKRPIVASRTPAIMQIVSDEEVFFHEPDDSSDLARQINLAFENRRLAEEKSERAFQKSKEYSWDKRARRITDFISSKL